MNNNVTSIFVLYIRKSLMPTDVRSFGTRQGIFTTFASQIIHKSASQTL